MPNKIQFKTHEDYLKWYRLYRKSKKWLDYHRKHIKNWRIKN